MNRREFLCAAAAVAAAGGCATGAPPTVRVAAGEVGGFYHEFTDLLAAADPGAVHVRPVTTTGSQANLGLLERGEADAAMALADSVDAGGGGLVALGRVYENYVQLVVAAESPVRAVADLRGARISLGASGSGAALTGERLLRAAGLDPGGDVAVTHLALREAVSALIGGGVDALLWAGGVPTGVLDVPGTLRLVDLGDLARPLRDRFGYLYDLVVVPADAYPGTPAVRTIGVANLLVTTRSLPDATAAAVTELLIGRAERLVPDEAAGTQFLDVRSLIGTAGVPLHPGAVAVYRRHHG
ncbi:TAXI family TRAP transporter solute-binding subunit [Nocardia sp. BMG51109]|uniref:TAXI family TRAP transporter solute-binding subunit n=1 Tax=Nocardia sp. BMG51109 TaxID=1056816 RepID=UPI0004668EF4|nr:TAXI family TRAP transporter solute-binding subunit [Nocardia sp. BMG51109]